MLHRIAITCLLAASAALAAPAWAETLTVTRGDDDPVSPDDGSLRAVLASAKPGDIILLGVPTITLEASLSIPAATHSVTLAGAPTRITAAAVGTAPAIDVSASGVDFRRITFERVGVFVASPGPEMLDGTSVKRCRFTKHAELNLFRVVLADIGAEKGADANTFDGGRLRMTGCERAQVRSNTFRKAVVGLDDVGGKGLAVRWNVFAGSTMQLAPAEAVIESNRVTVRDIPGIVVTNDPTAPGAPAGRVRIEDNKVQVSGEADGVVLTSRGNALVTKNRVIGVGTSRGTGIRFDAGADGPSLNGIADFNNNTVLTCGTGISVSALGARAPIVSVGLNSVFRCHDDGIAIQLGTAALAIVATTNNEISSNGQGGAGAGVRIATSGGLVRMTGDRAFRNTVGVVVETAPANTFLAKELTVARNRGDGMLFRPFATGVVTEITVSANTGAGVFVDADALVWIAQPRMHGNRGPGIDLAPRGVTPNEQTRTGNEGVPWPEHLAYESVPGKLTGTTFPGATVEVFAVETGDRAGNPKNGEGEKFLFSVTADGSGKFVAPATGRLVCPASGRVTCTATTTDAVPVTSEFSPDVICRDEVGVIFEDPPATPELDEATLLSLTIVNPTTLPFANGRLQIFDGKTLLLDTVIPSIPGRAKGDELAVTKTVSRKVTFQHEGRRQVRIALNGRVRIVEIVEVVDPPTPGPGGVTATWSLPPGTYAAGETIVIRFELQNPNPSPLGPYEYEYLKTTKAGTKSIGLFHDVTLIPAQDGYEMLTLVPVILVAGKNTIVCKFGGATLATATITAH